MHIAFWASIKCWDLGFWIFSGKNEFWDLHVTLFVNVLDVWKKTETPVSPIVTRNIKNINFYQISGILSIWMWTFSTILNIKSSGK